MSTKPSIALVLLLAGLAAIASLTTAPAASAHDGPGLSVHARRDGPRVHVSLEADDAALAVARRDVAHAGAREALAPLLLASVVATTPDGVRVPLLSRASGGSGLVLEGDAPDGDLVLSLSLFGTDEPGEAIVHLDDGAARRLLRVELPGLVRLSRAARTGSAPSPAPSTPPAPSIDVLSFVHSGVEHILTGWDHLAFLVVLLVAGRRLGQVVAVASAFTLAHSLTLTLAACDLVRLPSAPVEAAIAASIVIAAVGNLLTDVPRHRAALAFGFGLVHGLGFSSGLAEMLGGSTGGRVGAVLGFNLGVELGQLAVLLVVTPLLLAWRRRAPRVYALVGVRETSVAVAALGFVWLAQRTLA